ncbi:hypothetical protein ACVWZA_002281 [Sphingomonas sp. UYAg733]
MAVLTIHREASSWADGARNYRVKVDGEVPCNEYKALAE